MLVAVGRPSDARRVLTEGAASIAKAYGDTHQRYGTALRYVGIAERQLGRIDVALEHFERAQEILAAKYDDDDLRLAWNLLHWGIALAMNNDVDAGIRRFNDGIKIYQARSAAEHPDVLLAEIHFAHVINDAGRVDRTQKAYRQLGHPLGQLLHNVEFAGIRSRVKSR